MKAELNSHELEEAFAFVTKGVRGNKVHERAKALLIFGDDGLCVEFNDLSANCPAQFLESGKYALNRFIFRPLLQTFKETKLVLEITEIGINIGRSRVAHSRLHGWFTNPEIALQNWERYRST